MSYIEALKQWAGRSWWRWLLIALPITVIPMVWALWPSKTQSPVFEEPRIDAEADKQIEHIDAKKQQAAQIIREELKRRQDEAFERSKTAPADKLRDDLLKGAQDD